MSESGMVTSLQKLCESKGELGRLGWKGVVALVQGTESWGPDSRLHFQVQILQSIFTQLRGQILNAQVADLLLKRMVAAHTRGEEDRMGEILLLLDR